MGEKRIDIWTDCEVYSVSIRYGPKITWKKVSKKNLHTVPKN